MEATGLLGVASEITCRNADLLCGDEFGPIADGVLAAVAASGARSIVGATPVGYAICGAIIARSEGRLRLWRSGLPGPVLVIDGVTASTISADAVRDQLERQGLEASIHVAGMVDPAPREYDSIEGTGLFGRRRSELVA